MNYKSGSNRSPGFMGVLRGLGLAWMFAAGAQAVPEEGVWSTNANDVAQCQARLNKVFEAIKEYERSHGKLPNWLSDLHPEFVDNPRSFVCPVVERMGDLESWRAGVRGSVFIDPILPNSYSYEFCANEYMLWAGIRSTEQEYKLRQMKVEGVGQSVPILRCLAHRPIINLAYEGRFYESGRYWEDNLTGDKVSHFDLLPAAIFRDLAPQPGQHPAVRVRPPDTPEPCLDLTPYYHVPLEAPWLFRNPKGHDLASLATETGRLSRTSIPFDARGLIQLRSRIMPSPYPERLDAIQVGRRATHLHFLLGTINRPFWTEGKVSVGEEIGHFEVILLDGDTHVIPILYGRDVVDWIVPPGPPPAAEAHPAWEGRNARGHVRTYVMTWTHPHPEIEIKALNFVSTQAESAPFLMAVTLDPP